MPRIGKRLRVNAGVITNDTRDQNRLDRAIVPRSTAAGLWLAITMTNPEAVYRSPALRMVACARREFITFLGGAASWPLVVAAVRDFNPANVSCRSIASGPDKAASGRTSAVYSKADSNLAARGRHAGDDPSVTAAGTLDGCRYST